MHFDYNLTRGKGVSLAACHYITARRPVASLCDILQCVIVDGSYWMLMIINMISLTGKGVKKMCQISAQLRVGDIVKIVYHDSLLVKSESRFYHNLFLH